MECIVYAERENRWGKAIHQTSNCHERENCRKKEAALERRQNDGKQIQDCRCESNISGEILNDCAPECMRVMRGSAGE